VRNISRFFSRVGNVVKPKRQQFGMLFTITTPTILAIIATLCSVAAADHQKGRLNQHKMHFYDN
jgi:hypothetical protein